eukprot:g15980.t1
MRPSDYVSSEFSATLEWSRPAERELLYVIVGGDTPEQFCKEEASNCWTECANKFLKPQDIIITRDGEKKKVRVDYQRGREPVDPEEFGQKMRIKYGRDRKKELDDNRTAQSKTGEGTETAQEHSEEHANSELLRRNIRSSLMRRIFPDHRGEPSDARLLEALARHGECGEGDSMDTSVAADAVAKLMRMGSENTAEDRTDAIIARMETFFENRSAESVFRERDGSYKRGPARVITRSLVDGLKPAGFKDKVMRELDILEGWKSDPELLFEVVLSAATAWRTVEHDAKFQKRQADRGKPGAGATATDAQTSSSRQQRRSRGQPKCWTCGESGHRSAECTSAGKDGSGTSSNPSRGSGGGASKAASRPPGRQQRQQRASVPQAKGTPAARGGSQSKPAATPGSAVGGRAAVPADGSAPSGGADPPVVPPDPRPAGGDAPAGGASAAGAVVPSWGASAPGGTSAFVSQEVAVRAAARERLVDLSIPGAAKPAACPVKAVLDSGAGVSTIPPGIADKLQAMFPDVTVVGAMDRPQPLKVVDGREILVTKKTCPLRVALHTSWGPVVLAPEPLAVMPGTDDVMIIGTPMMARLGIDVDAMADARAREGQEARVSGVESPTIAAARRVTLSVDALQPADAEEVPDEAVERLAARGPDMVMSPAQEERGRKEALDAAVASAASAGLSDQGVSRLGGIVQRHWNAFRRALRGDPPADVEPMRVVRKPGTHSVKARPRTYSPAKTAWLTTCLATLVAMGLLFLNKQAVWASAVMATPKNKGYRMVGDFRSVNKVVEKSPGVMPNQEACMQRLSEATCYGSLDMLQGYWQMPLAPESQEMFTIVGPGGLYTPTRVPQGVLNATSYFQATMTELLDGLNCMVWVDDVIFWGHDEDDLLYTLELVLERLESVGLFAAAHKCIFFDTSIKWCGKVYSCGDIKHDPERLSGLANLRRPETAGELMQFLQAVNWLRTSLPRMAEIVAPLRAFLEAHLADNPNRTKRVASNRAIAPQAWTPELVAAWDQAQDMVANAVTLYHPKEGRAVLMFPDASDEHWGSFLTQVPQSELDAGVAVEDMSHEPLGFLSGTFRGSQLRWATVDKEGFAIVRDFVKQCLHCMDSKAGEMVPRPLGATVHGKRPGEVLHFDYLHVGQSGPLGGDGLDETRGFATLASSSEEEWKVDVLDAEALTQHVRHIVNAQTALHKEVLDKVESNRAKQRKAASRGQLPNFTVGDYVLVARVRRSGLTPKLASTWTGPWRVVTAQQEHVYGVQNIISGEVRDVHVARMRFYSDSELDITSDLKEVFQHSFNQGEFEMEALINIGESHDGSGYLVRVRWSGFEADEDTWEPLKTLWEDAPTFVKQQLRKMKLGRNVCNKLKSAYGISID